jgi:hypothetical protein
MRGDVPLWNPYKRAGMPLAADTTAGALYPGNAPFLWLELPAAGDATADSAIFRTMDIVAVLHALLAGLSLYLFLAALGLEWPARILGGLVFACSGTMGWFAAWYIQIQNSAVWLPLILACVHNTSDNSPYRTRWIALGAVAVALQWLAGFPEFSLYSGLIAVAYAASLVRERGTQPIVAAGVVYTTGILLAAVQLFPALELQSLSRRSGALSLEAFQSLAASPSMLLGWIVPSQAAGMEFPPTAAYHFGITSVAAAVAGVFCRSRTSLFFTLLLAVGLLLSIGDATPVSAWLWHVPVLNVFRHPFKHLFEVSLAVSILAALGAGKLLTIASGARWPRLVAVAAILVTAVSLRVNMAPLVTGNPANADTSGRRPDVVAHLDPGARVLALRHFFLKRDPSFLLGDFSTEFEVPAVNGAGPYLWNALAEAAGMVEEEITFRRGLFGQADRTLAVLSCPYVIQTKRGDAFWPPLDRAAYRVAEEFPDAKLAKREDALPRFRFVPDVRCGSDTDVTASLQRGDPDPANTALVDCNGTRAIDGQPSLPSPPGLVEEQPGHIALATEVPAGANAFLVVSQADLPGWRATTDGRSAQIRRVQGLVQGIEVPGGTTRVELDYEPRTFLIGAATSAITLVLLLAGLVVSEARRARQPRGT